MREKGNGKRQRKKRGKDREKEKQRERERGKRIRKKREGEREKKKDKKRGGGGSATEFRTRRSSSALAPGMYTERGIGRRRRSGVYSLTSRRCAAVDHTWVWTSAKPNLAQHGAAKLTPPSVSPGVPYIRDPTPETRTPALCWDETPKIHLTW